MNPDFSVMAEQYCGIRNQGATCYMNSILQALFHLPAFRKIVFQMPAGAPGSVVDSLQHLFAQMQTGTDPVSTEMLVQSFGWDDLARESQQDVQEFMRLIIDNLETKLKDTPQETAIADLLRGTYRSFVRCVSVDCESARDEAFYDLSLVVKGCKSLEDSLLKFLETERLDGPNQYATENFGKQDAIMGSELVSLPPVLHIHLRRFEYDARRDRMVKVNSRYVFPESMDMAEFVPAAQGPMIYDLFGVLVHAGEAHEGHFWAFLRTSTSPDWFEFNDSNVMVSNADVAVHRNAGGRDPKIGNFSAYMLVYMRRSELYRLFCPIPPSLVASVGADGRTELDTEEVFCTLSVYTEKMIVPRFLDFGSSPLSLRVRESDTLESLHHKLEAALDRKCVRLWYCDRYFLRSPVPCDRQLKVVPDLTGTRIFVEFIYRSPSHADVLLFCMFYDKSGEPLHFVSSLLVPRKEKLSSVANEVRNILSISRAASLLAFRPAVSGTLAELGQAKSIQELGIPHGGFVVFQFAPQEQNTEIVFPVRASPAETGPVSYFDVFPDELPTMVELYFRMVLDSVFLTLLKPDSSEVRVAFPSSGRWPTFHIFIARVIEIPFNPDEEVMLVYVGHRPVPVDETHYKVVGRSFLPDSVVSVLTVPKGYEDVCIRVLVDVSLDGMKVHKTQQKLFRTEATLEDLLAEIRETELDADTPLRVVFIKRNRITGIAKGNELLARLRYPLRVEAIPPDQRVCNEGEFSVRVEFKQKGAPFLLRVVPGEQMKETRRRLQAMMKVSAEDLMRLQICSIGEFERYLDIPDESELAQIATPATRIGILAIQTGLHLGK
jgi:ubiquitin C-terminal hydrolase